MTFCATCGCEIPEGANACPACYQAVPQNRQQPGQPMQQQNAYQPQPGQPVQQQNGYQPQPGQPMQQQNNYQPQPGQPMQQQNGYQPQPGQPMQQQNGYSQQYQQQNGYQPFVPGGNLMQAPPMGFHKFLCYFSMPASILLNIYNIVSEAMYLDQLYGTALAIVIFEIVCLVASIALAIFNIIGLHKLNSTATLTLKLQYIVSIVLNIVLSVFFITVNASALVAQISSCVGSIIGSAVFLIIISIYYKKRKWYFDCKGNLSQPQQENPAFFVNN